MFGQTTVDKSLWIGYETFRLVQMVFCGHNVPSCTALHVMLKGISVDKFHNLNFSFCIFVFEKIKSSW